ncbi:MAG: glycoside hydrolase family 13 protein [Jatrophihabitantaceae bacterium]
MAEAGAAEPACRSWWRDAVIYQIYLRSFADGDNDGTGDLAGVRSRLQYLADLGVDAIWFNPWYRSPMADGGYDVADYRQIDPSFGNLAEAEALIAEAAELGIRTIIDIVPNHVSDQHPWFQQALADGQHSAARDRFWFRPGRGHAQNEAPNEWTSPFGGGTWTRTKNPDGTPGEWYLHLFAPQQPDLNWNHPDVRAEHEAILRFWFDRGAAGVRIDSAALLVKDPGLSEVPADPVPGQHPYEDRDELHEIYRSWRAIAESYPDQRVLIGELWLPDADRFALYLRPDELHTAFNFDFLVCPWDERRLRHSIEATLAAHARVGAPATWVLSNHDVTRVVTRYGRADTSFSFAAKRHCVETDLVLGHRRARAAALLAAALPGSLYIYQGDELGLPEVEDIPTDQLTDPMYFRSGGQDPGRDGCRVPLPWSGATPPYGFSTGEQAAPSWLAQPSSWARLTVQAQLDEPASMLSMYRQALRIRRNEPDLRDTTLRWIEAGPGVLSFGRGQSFGCLVNLSDRPIELPAHRAVLLTSAALTPTGQLPMDAAAWLRLGSGSSVPDAGNGG